MAASRVRNVCAGPFGAFYDAYIERPRLARSIGRALWGIDPSLLYASMDAIAAAGSGETVVDVPCGGGVAFRALAPGQDVRYLAGDLDEKMLARAARRAQARSLPQVRLDVADMTALPYDDACADLFVSFSGLHMIERPELAVAEIARCLRPGGKLVGTSFVREGAMRQRLLFAAGSLRGHARPPCRAELLRMLQDAGLDGVSVEPRRGFVGFAARKPVA